MDFGSLEGLGKIAGIAGIVVGAMLIVVQQILKNKGIAKLPPELVYRLFRSMIILVGVITIAGIAAWTWGGNPRTAAYNSLTNNVPSSTVTGRMSAKDRQLVEATAKGNTAQAASLLREGANPNAKDINGQTALHYAAANNRSEVAKLLVSHGANLNATNRWGDNPSAVAQARNLPRIVPAVAPTGTP